MELLLASVGVLLASVPIACMLGTSIVDCADSGVTGDDRQRPVALGMCLGDRRFEVAQRLGGISATGHHDIDGRADHAGIPPLGEPRLHRVGLSDAARVVFFETLQAHQVGAEREGLWRNE